MAKSKRIDAALRQHCEDILLVLAGESKSLLVVLTNWCKEKSISQVNSCIPNTRSSDNFSTKSIISRAAVVIGVITSLLYNSTEPFFKIHLPSAQAKLVN